MNQPRLLCAELFGVKPVPLQIARALVSEEYVGILQQVIDFRAIGLGVIKYRLTHPDLHVPGKRLDLGVVGPPDVEDVGPVVGEVSADSSPRNDMPHSERPNAVQRALSILLKSNRLAFADLL